MASPKLMRGRVSTPDSYYAVTTIVAGRRALFRDPASASCLADELSAEAPAIRFFPLAWTIMPDHLHLLLQIGNPPLDRCMQTLKSRTSRLLGTGPLWQAGYYDHCLRCDEDLLVQARYILENPVRAGIVERPRDYPYSWSIWGPDP
jgi:REP element-mobilizing transposase RayT